MRRLQVPKAMAHWKSLVAWLMATSCKIRLVLLDGKDLTVRFVNVDKPEEYIDITTYGDGVDSQDKAPGKAMTYGDKYALLKAYKIITGDDPDQTASAPLNGKEQKPVQRLGARGIRLQQALPARRTVRQHVRGQLAARDFRPGGQVVAALLRTGLRRRHIKKRTFSARRAGRAFF